MFTLLSAIENTVLTTGAVTLLGLALLQIGLRLSAGSGLSWIAPLLRYLVVVCGLLGGVVAVREQKNITITLLDRLLPGSWQPLLQRGIALAGAVVCAILCWAAIKFCRSEMEFATTAMLQVPGWIWSTIYPISFGLMALHFSHHCLQPPGVERRWHTPVDVDR